MFEFYFIFLNLSALHLVLLLLDFVGFFVRRRRRRRLRSHHHRHRCIHLEYNEKLRDLQDSHCSSAIVLERIKLKTISKSAMEIIAQAARDEARRKRDGG